MAQPTVYKFKPWARLSGDAQKVGEAIEQLREQFGSVSPQLVVEHAKDKESVLHGYFTWDNKQAASKYREVQASHLLRSIVAVRVEGVELTAPTRAFVSVRKAAEESELDEPGTYTSIREAVRIVDYREQLMENALRELDAYRLKYQLLSDVTGWGRSIMHAREALQTVLDGIRNKEAA